VAAAKHIDEMIDDVEKLRFTDSKQALNIAFSALELSRKINYPQGEAILLNKIGQIYSSISEYTKATEYIIEALPKLELYNMDYQISAAYNQLGNVFYDLANYETSFSYYNKSIYLAQRYQFIDRISIAYNNIGEIYKFLTDYDTALDYYERSLSEDRKIDFTACKGLSYINLAEIYYLKANYDKALKLIPVGLSLLNKFNYEIQVCEVYKLYALIYWKLNDCQKTRDNFIKALDTANQKMSFYLKIDILIFYHQFLAEQNQIELALVVLSEAYELALANNLYDKSLLICSNFTSIYEKIEDYESALKYYKLYISYSEKQNKERIAQIREGIELRIKTEEIKLEAEIDSLTGISNRRKFRKYLGKQWEHSKSNRHSLALIIIDIDFFKEYNDNCGHLKGDKCLITIADLLNSMIDKKYLLARYGGDEFVAVLPQTTLEEAFAFAEILRHGVMEAKIAHGHSAISDCVTITTGVAALIPTDDFTVDDLIKNADDALYEAKKSGRNKSIATKFGC
jgi:diguanylate cyclase (GGDEF)-like protein